MRKFAAIITGASAAALMLAQPVYAATENGNGGTKTGLIAGAGLLAIVAAIALADSSDDAPESP